MVQIKSIISCMRCFLQSFDGFLSITCPIRFLSTYNLIHFVLKMKIDCYDFPNNLFSKQQMMGFELCPFIFCHLDA